MAFILFQLNHRVQGHNSIRLWLWRAPTPTNALPDIYGATRVHHAMKSFQTGAHCSVVGSGKWGKDQ